MAESNYVSVTRAAYDATADVYAQVVGTELSAAVEAPLDRGLLAAFVEMVPTVPRGHVADLGCGPGRVAAFLAAQSLDVVGVDASQAMLAVARNAHPHINFEQGLLTALPIPDRSLAGAVYWYSIIHTPPDDVHRVWEELVRVLATDGQALLAFQSGSGEREDRSAVHGRRVALTSYRHSPDEVVRQLSEAGLQVRARAVREADFADESTPVAFVLARIGRGK